MKTKLIVILMLVGSLNGASLTRRLISVTQNGIVQVVRTTPSAIAISYSPKVLPTVRVTMKKLKTAAFVEYHISTSSGAPLMVTPQELFQKYASQFNAITEEAK